MEPQTNTNIKAIIQQMVKVNLLCELVKERPVIWDKSAEGYRNKDISGLAWEEIHRTIFDGYDSFSEDLKEYVGKS